MRLAPGAGLKRAAHDARLHLSVGELSLWKLVRNRALGFKFRRKVAIREWIVDFWCPSVKLALAVECDCGIAHLETPTRPDQELHALGIETLVLLRSEILRDPVIIQERIRAFARSRST